MSAALFFYEETKSLCMLKKFWWKLFAYRGMINEYEKGYFHWTDRRKGGFAALFGLGLA